ncbi:MULTISPECIES: LysR family transcriptional regulator [unclassified Adlercreutzia]|uniref:LysR family transcriptional regulator n=1 Tax=unclassified Adlercreutzia TaxID=2636013 RepID=UPI0013EBC182|nr:MULTISPECIES: LysR family transcriptional regulator [unclassified Adlercreutzia]
MEIRTLRYFLAVAQEGSLSHAAKRLHVTQPTLSRQLAALEDELGRQLYTRGHAGVSLTEHGAMLARYAESIVELADKAQADISLPAKTVSGSVHIAAGETRLVGTLVEAMRRVRDAYPLIDFQLYSGTTSDLMDGLVRGRFDLMLECEMQAHVNLNALVLPERDRWGMVMRRDDPLACRASVGPADLEGRALITPRQGANAEPLRSWLGSLAETAEIIAAYDLPSNVQWLVERGFGIAFTYEGLMSSDGSSKLAFVPLEPRIESRQGIIWRKSLPTKQAQVFLDVLHEVVEEAAK